MASRKFKTNSEYIASFPPTIRERLSKVRQAITSAAPKATEKISYNIPSFQQNGYLMYFAGFEKHIGFYPISKSIVAKFKTELAPYLSGKATAKFPHDKPLPLGLVKKIIKLRVKENEAKAKTKRPTKDTAKF